jgi:acyl carrier protein
MRREREIAHADVDEMVERLASIMERDIEDVVVPRDERGADSISRLNLDSLALISFLVAVADEFGIEWDPDVDRSVVQSFDAMARYVLANGGMPQR